MNLQTAERIAQMKARATVKRHGLRVSYQAGCRCLLCRAAKSRYNSERELARKQGDTRDLVSAEPARAHILNLSKIGVGYKTVADAAGVARCIVAMVRRGQRTQIRKSTERKILAVDRAAIADYALVSAEPSWRLLDELLDDGYTKKQLGKWLGSKAKIPSLQIPRDRITARKALQIQRLYDAIRAGKLRRDR